jgi:hypothetical protein
MRKIKIFLTMLAIAGVLFATSSCVDNTESDSVSELRKAKAEELKANGRYLDLKGAAEKTLADAQLILLTAQAATEEAEAEYRRALGDKEKALGEADKIRAEAERIKASGDSLKLAGEAARLLALADQISKEAEANAKWAAEDLLKKQAENAVLIAKEEEKLLKAQADVEKARNDAAIEYMKLVGDFDLKVANQYATLVTSLNGILQEISALETGRNRLVIEKAELETDLLFSIIDSVAYTKNAILALTNDIIVDSLRLQWKERERDFWKAPDTSKIRESLNDLIADTAKYATSLAKAKIALADAKTVQDQAKVARATAQSAYDVISNAYVKEQAKYDSIKKVYDAYLSLTTSPSTSAYYARGVVLKKGWTQDGIRPEDLSKSLALYQYEYNGVIYEADKPEEAYNNSRIDYDDQPYYEYSIYQDDKIEVTVKYDLGWPLGTTYVDYFFTVYSLVYVPADAVSFETKYSSAEDYEQQVNIWKYNITKEQEILTLAQQELTDSLVSLKILGAKKVEYYDDWRDSVNNQKIADEDNTKKQAAYTAALVEYGAGRLTRDQFNAIKAAYDGRDIDGVVLPAYKGGSLAALNLATIQLNNAWNRYFAVAGNDNDGDGIGDGGQYETVNSKVISLISNVISYYNTVKRLTNDLASAQDNLTLLKKGPRSKLAIDLAKAKEAFEAIPVPTGSDQYAKLSLAEKAYTAAQLAYSKANTNVGTEKEKYERAIEAYNSLVDGAEVLRWYLSVGGNPDQIEISFNKLETLEKDVIAAEDKLAKDILRLTDVMKYTNYPDKLYAELTTSQRKQIAEKDVAIKAINSQIDVLDAKRISYDKTIKEFLAKYYPE